MRIDHRDLLGLGELVEDLPRPLQQRWAIGERLLSSKPLPQRSRMLEEVQLPR
jgi:hypothetical protein